MKIFSVNIESFIQIYIFVVRFVNIMKIKSKNKYLSE